jgi:hypothetical protein
MSPFTKFKEPTQKRVLKGDLPERLQRVQKAAGLIHQSYIYNLTTDKHAITVSLYAAQFPENTRRELIELQRVRLLPEQFETDDNLTIDREFKVKEAFVYKVHTRVMYTQNPDTDVLAYRVEREGIYARPFGSIQRDQLGNAISSKVAFWRSMFWIPFTEENVKAMLDEFNGRYTKSPKLWVARSEGESPYSAVYTCYDLQEWLHGDFICL